MEAIKTVGLSKLYGKKRAVDNLSFTIGSGEIYGFVGRNGAGKSTVMKMLAGLILPSSGEIEILGEKMAPGCTSRRLGALIENPGLYPGLSGFDNVMVRALALGIPDAKTMSINALDIVGLSDVAKKRTKTYSLGMKQRLGLALALVGVTPICFYSMNRLMVLIHRRYVNCALRLSILLRCETSLCLLVLMCSISSNVWSRAMALFAMAYLFAK